MNEKVCGMCKNPYPRTNEFFHRDKGKSDGLSARCKSCAKLKTREWTNANPERKRQQDAAYYQANSERIKDRVRQWSAANQDKIQARIKRTLEENPDYWHERYEARIEQVRASNAEWRRSNPEYQRLYAQLHKAEQVARQNLRVQRIAENGGSHTVAEWEALKAYYGNVCLRCFRPADEVELERDHVIPVSKGGTNDISNIQPLCGTCNLSKGTRIIDYRP